MAARTVPAILRASLQPILAIREDLTRALTLGQLSKLSPPFLYTIRGCVRDLDVIWENMNDIAQALDPPAPKPKK